MFEVRWSRLPGIVAVPALVALAVAGCSAGGPAPRRLRTRPAARRPAPRASAASYTATQLRGALLTKINGQSPAAPVESGAYGSLTQVKATKNAMNGVTVNPAAVRADHRDRFQLTVLHLGPGDGLHLPVGSNGISEVLLAPPSATAALALGPQLPAACTRYTATVKGKTFVYTVSERTVRDLGHAARAMNIKRPGRRASTCGLWSTGPPTSSGRSPSWAPARPRTPPPRSPPRPTRTRPGPCTDTTAGSGGAAAVPGRAVPAGGSGMRNWAGE